MSVMTSVIPHGRPFTVDDLEGMPDDGTGTSSSTGCCW